MLTRINQDFTYKNTGLEITFYTNPPTKNAKKTCGTLVMYFLVEIYPGAECITKSANIAYFY
jgi:hypothetical protein